MDDFDASSVGMNAIDQDEGRMADNQFSGAQGVAGTAEIRMSAQQFGLLADFVELIQGGTGVALSDMPECRDAGFFCSCCPEHLHWVTFYVAPRPVLLALL